MKLIEINNEILNKTIWGLVCQKCYGGGMNHPDVCDSCNGSGIVKWEVNSFEALLKKQAQHTQDEMLLKISKIPKTEMTFSDIEKAINQPN